MLPPKGQAGYTKNFLTIQNAQPRGVPAGDAALSSMESSISTRPAGWRLSSRSNITFRSLCFINQAVGQDTPTWRFSASAETPVLDCVIMCIATNHLGSGSLLDSKVVPLIRLH